MEELIKIIQVLGPEFMTAAILLGLLVILWRAKVTQEKQHREDLLNVEKKHKEDLHQLFDGQMALQKETTTAMVTMGEVLRNVDRTLDKIGDRV